MANPLADIRYQPVEVQRDRLLALPRKAFDDEDVIDYVARRPETLEWLLRRRAVPDAVLDRAVPTVTGRYTRSDQDAERMARLMYILASRGALGDAERTRLRDDVFAYLAEIQTGIMPMAGDLDRAQRALGILVADPEGLDGLDVKLVLEEIGVPEASLEAAYRHPRLPADGWAAVEALAVEVPAEHGGTPVTLEGLPAVAADLSDLELVQVIEEAAAKYRHSDAARRIYERVSDRLLASSDPDARLALLTSELRWIRLDAVAHLGPTTGEERPPARSR